MRSSRGGGQDHQEAVARRLALLSAELEAVRESLRDGEDPLPVPGGAEDEPARPGWEPPRDPGPPAPGPPLPGGPPSEVRGSPTGRHVHRPVRRAFGLLVETEPGRLALGPAQLLVIAALVLVAVVVAGWLSVRAQPQVEPVAPAAAPSALATPAPSSPAAAAAASSGGAESPAVLAQGTSLVVDVAGKVRRPGIAVLAPGARVVDALKAAGGARRGVDLSTLNLARPLVDGEQLLVGVPAPTGVAAAAAPTSPPVGSAGAPAGGGLVNINLGDQTELETLPGVGPVTAQAILAWREENGSFSAVEELLEVDGIGPATLEKLVPHVTL